MFIRRLSDGSSNIVAVRKLTSIPHTEYTHFGCSPLYQGRSIDCDHKLLHEEYEVGYMSDNVYFT